MVQKFPKLLVLEEAGTETDSPVLRAYGTDAPSPQTIGEGASARRLMVLVRSTRVVVSALVQKCHEAHMSHVLITYLNLYL